MAMYTRVAEGDTFDNTPARSMRGAIQMLRWLMSMKK